MIGLARSGKSTISRKWVNHEVYFTIDGQIKNYPVLTQVEPRVIVNGDSWRLAMGHRYNTYVEPIVAAHVQIAVRALLKTHNVLVDETNTNEKSILKWLEEDIDAVPVFVNTPAEICKERAIKTGQPDLVPVIDRMNMNLYKTFGKNLDILGVVQKLKEEAQIRHSFNRIVV